MQTADIAYLERSLDEGTDRSRRVIYERGETGKSSPVMFKTAARSEGGCSADDGMGLEKDGMGRRET